MTKDIENIEINKRLNLYTVKTKKFKTDLIGVYIKRHLSKHEASLNALLTRILERGTMKYKTAKAINIKLESSYGMILVSDVVKYGEYHILQFKLQFPNGKHILSDGIFEDALDILREVIFNPLLVDDLFDEDYFNQEKENLIDEIESRVNDKMSYSLERCIEMMYEDTPYSEYVYGHKERIESITLKELTEHYKKVISESLIDVCVMGDLETETVVDLIKEHFKLDQEHCEKTFKTCKHQSVDHIKYQTELHPVKQAKLVLGYRTQICQIDPLYEASVLAYHIFGGGATSKLFMRLREEEGLCYYVYAKSDKYMGCMYIGAGVEGDDAETVTKEVSEILEHLKIGGVSERDLQLAIEAMVTSIQSLSDFPNSFINFYYTEVLGRPLVHMDFEEMISAYKRVTVEDITEVYRKLELDTVYLLKGETERNSDGFL